MTRLLGVWRVTTMRSREFETFAWTRLAERCIADELLPTGCGVWSVFSTKFDAARAALLLDVPELDLIDGLWLQDGLWYLAAACDVRPAWARCGQLVAA